MASLLIIISTYFLLLSNGGIFSHEKIPPLDKKNLVKDINFQPDFSVGDTCYVNAKVIGIRGEPLDTSIEFENLYRNYKVIITEKPQDKWIRVSYTNGDVGVLGYVLKEYLSKKKAVITSDNKHNGNTFTSTVLSVGDTCYVNKYALAVRSEASETSQELDSIYYNYLVTIIECPTSEWVRICYMNGDVGVVGYILKKYLSKTKISKR